MEVSNEYENKIGHYKDHIYYIVSKVSLQTQSSLPKPMLQNRKTLASFQKRIASCECKKVVGICIFCYLAGEATLCSNSFAVYCYFLFVYYLFIFIFDVSDLFGS